MSINNTVNVPRRAESSGVAWVIAALAAAAALITVMFYGVPATVEKSGVETNVNVEQPAQPIGTSSSQAPGAEAPAATPPAGDAPPAAEAPAAGQ